MTRTIHSVSLLCALLISACGHSEIGEACDTAGATDECVDNAICTNEADGAAVCRKLCDEQADCADTESCNGISGTNLKSCQPND